MAMDFPSSPTNGQTFIGTNGLQYVYQTTSGWSLNLARYNQVRSAQTATAGQTSFPVTGGYVPGMVDVYKNGLKLANTNQVTVTSGTSVVLASAASNGDIIEIVGMTAFSLAAGYLRQNVTILTASSGTYTPSSAVRAVVFELVAPGGGSGGTAVTAGGQVAVAGSGSAGARALKYITTLAASYAYTIGAAGTAGGAGNNSGGAGGDVVIASVTAHGGNAGAGGPAVSTFTMAAPLIGGTASSGDENYTGNGSNVGIADATTQVARSGNGGDTPYSPGGLGVSGAAGATPDGYGGGASGASSLASAAARAGAVGAAGCIRVTELF